MASPPDSQDRIVSTTCPDDYARGVAHGLYIAVSLRRAGCRDEDLALLLDDDPAQAGWMWYRRHVEDLRRILQSTPCTETDV